MKINAVIAEYNPFHTGHAFQLVEGKKNTGSDYNVVVMSGDFVQRGEPAIFNKYVRTQMALENGADLVLELPTLYSASSAEFFATGAVSMLEKLGCIDTLSFGSESGDIALLTSFAKILAKEPEEYKEKLKKGLQQGFNYPIARNLALFAYEPPLAEHSDILSSPNNILAIEYIKALLKCYSKIAPYTVKRSGSDYHNRSTENNFCSALALRQAISEGRTPDTFASYLPKGGYSLMEEELHKGTPMYCDDFSDILYYKLVLDYPNGYTEYLDVSEELSRRIQNNLFSFQSFSQFCDLLKTKEMTYTRISRCLLHIVLGITTDDMKQAETFGHATYARILGFRKDSSELLHEIKKHSSIPLISKLADAPDILNEQALEQFNRQIGFSHIYAGIAACKSQTAIRNEYQQPIVIL